QGFDAYPVQNAAGDLDVATRDPTIGRAEAKGRLDQVRESKLPIAVMRGVLHRNILSAIAPKRGTFTIRGPDAAARRGPARHAAPRDKSRPGGHCRERRSARRPPSPGRCSAPPAAARSPPPR